VRFLGFSVTAMLLADAALVALAVAPEKVPGSYWLIVYISAFEGLIGGLYIYSDLSSSRWC
jgi:hypothetical protein